MADGTIYIDTRIDENSLKKEMKNTEAAIKKTEARLDKLIEKQIRYVETGGNADSRAFAGMEYDIAQTRAQLEGLNLKLTDLRASQAQATSGTAMLKNAVNLVKNAFQNLGPNIKGVAKNLPKAVGKATISGFKKLGTVLKNVGKRVLGVGKNAKSSRGSMMKMLGTSLLMGLAFKALMGIMNGLKEGMNNLAQYSGDTNKDLSALKSSLTQLKNSFATAFAPILSVVTPILIGFIGTISEVVSKIGMLTAAMTGKKTFTKAIAVQEDYAASLSDSADAAKDASKYTSGLDEITRFSDGSDSGKTSGNANPSEMFEEVSIDNSAISLAEQFKQATADGDWKGVGSILAEKVNSTFSNINFGKVGRNLGEKIKNAFDTAIGFIQNVDWQMLGHKVADFITGIDWSGIANRLYEGLGSVVGGLAGFLWGLIEDGWNSVVLWWKENAYEDGKFTLEGLLNGIVEGLANIGTWIVDNIFTPFIEGFKKAFGIHSPSTEMKTMGGFLVDGLKNGIDLSKVVETFENFKKKISDIFGSIGNKIKEKINAIIGFINGMISGVTKGINSIIKSLNKLSFTIPDWLKHVPGASGIAGKKFGFNISTITAPRIPYLATGAVIPPNAPFMAMLGDQKHGTNLETPESLLRQIVREETAGQRGGGNYRFTAQINRRTLFEEIIEEAKIVQMGTGLNPFELA